MARLSQGFLSNLGRPAMTQSLFDLGTAIGNVPNQYADKKKRDADAAELSKHLQGSAEWYEARSQIAQRDGDTKTAIEMGESAREMRRLQNQRAKVVDAATKAGLPAEQIQALNSADAATLLDTMKDLRKKALDDMPSMNPSARKAMASGVGIDPIKFKSLGLAEMSDDAFNTFISGQGGDLEFFLNDSGEVETYRVKDGLVWDEEKGWIEAKGLGLSKAPEVSKVENVSNKFAEDLGKEGAKSFAEQYDAAKKSADALGTIRRTKPTIDNMFTGSLAETKTELSKIAKAFGFPIGDLNSSIQDTEVYVAESGKRVAEYITNLGAGTGLSDADREYAKKVVGGEITMDAESLKRILSELEKGAQRNIKRYQTTHGRVREALGEQGAGALAFFSRDFEIPDAAEVPASRSPAANNFLMRAREGQKGE